VAPFRDPFAKMRRGIRYRVRTGDTDNIETFLARPRGQFGFYLRWIFQKSRLA
jgi:hypothetical protein